MLRLYYANWMHYRCCWKRDRWQDIYYPSTQWMKNDCGGACSFSSATTEPAAFPWCYTIGPTHKGAPRKLNYPLYPIHHPIQRACRRSYREVVTQDTGTRNSYVKHRIDLLWCMNVVGIRWPTLTYIINFLCSVGIAFEIVFLYSMVKFFSQFL